LNHAKNSAPHLHRRLFGQIPPVWAYNPKFGNGWLKISAHQVDFGGF